MTTKRFNISLPLQSLVALDDAAGKALLTLSAYIRRAVEQQILIDQYVADEFTDKDSLHNVVRRAHLAKMSSLGLAPRK